MTTPVPMVVPSGAASASMSTFIWMSKRLNRTHAMRVFGLSGWK